MNPLNKASLTATHNNTGSKESERRCHLVVDSINDGVYELDTNGKFTFVNKAIQDRSGIPLEKFVGLHFLDIISPKDHNRVKANLERLMAGEKVPPYELEYVTSNGSTLCVEVNTQPIYNNGRVIGLIGVSRDITERKMSDKALRESEEKFHIITENSPNMIFINKGGKIVYVNNKCEQIMGYKQEDFLSPDFDFLCLIAPESRQSVKSNFKKHMNGLDVGPQEYTLLTKAGRKIEAIITTKLMNYAGDKAILGIVTDITKRKHAEAALREAHEELEKRVKDRKSELARINEELNKQLLQVKQVQDALRSSEEKARALAELLPEIVFETDQEGVLQYTNRIGFQKFGYTQDEFDGGLSCFNMVAPEDRVRLKKNFRRLMKGKSLGSGEYLAQTKNATKFPVIIHSNIIQNEHNQPIGLRGVMVDITAQKCAQKNLLTYQEKLRSLASRLSLAEERIRRKTAIELHDTIGQNMAFAKMKLQALRKSATSQSIVEAIDETLELVDDAIQNTRGIISELSPPILYELGLVPALEWLIEHMQDKNDLLIDFEDDKQPKPLSEEVRVLLFQAVRELIINVTKHANVERAKLSISRCNERIRIIVSDDGVGFDISENGPAAKNEGGFGLFSIRERLEPIGGKVKIQSEPYTGTQVTIEAPLTVESTQGDAI